MKSIDELLPGVVAGIIERAEQKQPKQDQTKSERSQSVGSSTLDSLKSMFEEG